MSWEEILKENGYSNAEIETITGTNMSPTYDSTAETREHILKVQLRLSEVMLNLKQRALKHDLSKLESPEKEAFDQIGPKLKDIAYGSPEYRKTLRDFKPALDHHYACNDHHPEHYPGAGLQNMSLLALIEMLADWKAAGERHDPPTPFLDSLNNNGIRFNIPGYLMNIFYHTAEELGWL